VPKLMLWCRTLLNDVIIIFINKNARAKERGQPTDYDSLERGKLDIRGEIYLG